MPKSKMKANIRVSDEPTEPKERGRYISISIKDIPTTTMTREIADALKKVVPIVVEKAGGQLTLEESEGNKEKKEEKEED